MSNWPFQSKETEEMKCFEKPWISELVNQLVSQGWRALLDARLKMIELCPFSIFLFCQRKITGCSLFGSVLLPLREVLWKVFWVLAGEITLACKHPPSTSSPTQPRQQPVVTTRKRSASVKRLANSTELNPPQKSLALTYASSVPSLFLAAPCLRMWVSAC